MTVVILSICCDTCVRNVACTQHLQDVSKPGGVKLAVAEINIYYTVHYRHHIG